MTVSCPVRLVEGEDTGAGPPGPERVLYVWTADERAVDAYEEALRVLQGWPNGSRPVDVAPMGLYIAVAGAG